MHRMKLKRSKKDMSTSGDDSDSDHVDEFTAKFMSHIAKVSPKDIMRLSKTDEMSDNTTDSDSEPETSDIMKHTTDQSERPITTKSRLIESQTLEEESPSDDDDEDDENDDENQEESDDESVSVSEEENNDLCEDEEISSRDDGSETDSSHETDDEKISCKQKTERELHASDDDTEAEKNLSQPMTEDTFKKLRQELADVPFAELQKLKEKIGIKAYNQAMFGETKQQARQKIFKRENKNRPTEMSSKRPVPRFREVIQVKKKVSRDPRFDDLSGEYNERVFKQAYSFLNDLKQREKIKLIKQYEKEKDSDKKKQIELLIKRINQQEKVEREKEMKKRKEEEWRRRELELVKQGKRPYFPKKVDAKKLELAEKFRELKKSGKVEKYMAKRRKKAAAKDRKRLPNKHFVST